MKTAAAKLAPDSGEVGADDVSVVGGKCASPGELSRALVPKGVREETGLVNVKAMIPFCRAVEEGERNGAVERMVAHAIEAARRAGKKIGIRGQAPSDYPEFARFLVERGINSISLNPDTVVQTTRTILEAEGRAGAATAAGSAE